MQAVDTVADVDLDRLGDPVKFPRQADARHEVGQERGIEAHGIRPFAASRGDEAAVAAA